MKILIVSATRAEVQGLLTALAVTYRLVAENQYSITLEKQYLSLTFLWTGVGATATAYRLTRQLAATAYHLAVNIGIAGAFEGKHQIGDVVSVVTDRFADVGAAAANGDFLSVFDLALADPDTPPFRQGILLNPLAEKGTYFAPAHALTVQTTTGTQAGIAQLRARYPEVGIETMEGAAFFYVCLQENIDFLALRSISNAITPRDKSLWDIPLALQRLHQTVGQLIAFYES